MDIAYDGSPFHGYAAQPGLRTVQGELEAALHRLVGAVETAVAGRTDAGVHASGQVVSFESGDPVDPTRAKRSLNKMLAPQIAVLRLVEGEPGFHARFSAVGRCYRYLVLNREAPDPFLAGRAWHVVAPLDVDAMAQTCGAMEGEHDFASFCRRSGDAPTERKVFWCGWHRDGELIELSIAANSFCHQMVRSIAAFGVTVGLGKRDAGEVRAVLEAADRTAVGGVAPPHGLTLVAVGYAGEPLVPPTWLVRH